MWKKLGLIFSPSEFGISNMYLNIFAQAPNAINLENKLRIYFTSRTIKDSSGMFISRPFYFEVKSFEPLVIDKIQTDPVLETGNLGEFDEFGIYPFSVLQIDDELIAVYGGWTRKTTVPFDVNLGLAKSLDGNKFARVGNGPILAGNENEPFVITSPKIRKYGDTFFLFYTAGTKWFKFKGRYEIVYKIKMARSRDLITWERLSKNIVPNKIGEDEAQACPDVFFHSGKYHMFFCYRQPTDFRSNPKNSYKLGYAFSEDLINWTRLDEKIDISNSRTGWDSKMVAYPNIIQFKNEIYMLYVGNGVGETGIGAAKLIGEL